MVEALKVVIAEKEALVLSLTEKALETATIETPAKIASETAAQVEAAAQQTQQQQKTQQRSLVESC
jgi:hypothetical protein